MPIFLKWHPPRSFMLVVFIYMLCVYFIKLCELKSVIRKNRFFNFMFPSLFLTLPTRRGFTLLTRA